MFGQDKKGTYTYEDINIFALALDPSFWQALGKALGWKYEDSRDSSIRLNGQWIESARRFYDLVLTNGDKKDWEYVEDVGGSLGGRKISALDKFWEEILPTQEK